MYCKGHEFRSSSFGVLYSVVRIGISTCIPTALQRVLVLGVRAATKIELRVFVMELQSALNVNYQVMMAILPIVILATIWADCIPFLIVIWSSNNDTGKLPNT